MTAEQILKYLDANNLGISRNLHPNDNSKGKVWSCSNQLWNGNRNYSTQLTWGKTIAEAVERYANGEFSISAQCGS